MSTHHLRTCRVCGGVSSNLLKYGLRHYAHHACYLDYGYKLADLKPWQVAAFPFLVLKKRDLLDEALRIVQEEDDKRKSRGQEPLSRASFAA